MTDDDRADSRLDPFDPAPPTWATMRAEDVVRQLFEFAPGPGGRFRRRVATPPVVRITDRYVVGVLDLRAVEVPYLLEFVRCRFDSPPDLRQAKLAGCEFFECWLPGVEGHNLYSDNDVRLVGGSRVRGRLDLTDAEISGSLELTGCRLDNEGGYALHADRLQLVGALLASNVEVTGQLRIPGMRTGGDINLVGAHLANPHDFALDGEGIHIGGNLRCLSTSQRTFRCAGQINLRNSRIDADFSMRGAELIPAAADAVSRDSVAELSFDPRATLIADRCSVSGNVDLDRGFASTGTIRMVNARIGGSLRLTGSTIDLSEGAEPFAEPTAEPAPGPYAYRALHLDGLDVGGGIDARKARVAGQLRMVDVTTRSSVIFDGAVLSNRNGDVIEGRRFTTGGDLDARGMTVFGSMLLPEAVIGANLDLRASRFVNPGRYRRDRSHKPSVDLRTARIGRDLVCASGERENQAFRAHGEIRIRRAEVSRQTNFHGSELGSNLDDTAINAFGLITHELRVDVAVPPRGNVNLRHARCSSLLDNDKFWDATGYIDLDDFRYDALAVPIQLDDDAQILRRLRLLRGAMGDSYRPGPYDQFAAMLRTSGNEEHAATVLMAKQRWRYDALAEGKSLLGPPVRMWSLLQRWVIGYGYRPMRSVAALILLLLATLVAAATTTSLSTVALFAIYFTGTVLLATVVAGLSHRLTDFATSTAPRKIITTLEPVPSPSGVVQAVRIKRSDAGDYQENPDATSPLKAAVGSPILIEAYLDTDDPVVARIVFSALDDLVEFLGYERPERETIQRGSLWRRATTWSKKGVTADELNNLVGKVARALELHHIDLQQAEFDVKSATAVAQLIDKLRDVNQACLRVGSILVVKYEGDNGPVIFSRNLSQAEMKALERFPEIQSKPRNVMESLAAAITTLDGEVADGLILRGEEHRPDNRDGG